MQSIDQEDKLKFSQQRTFNIESFYFLEDFSSYHFNALSWDNSPSGQSSATQFGPWL